MGLEISVPAVDGSAPLRYVKSSKSCQSECVEVARRVDGVYVRDSKDPAGPRLFFDNEAWVSFLVVLKGGTLPGRH